MRICHIITRLIIGGAQENTLLSCEGQRARGHEVTLITGPGIGPEGTLMERAQGGGFRVEVIDEMRRAILPAKDWSAYRRMVALLKEIRPDVVHTHSSKAGILGRWAAREAGAAAIVHTIHGLSFTASNRAAINWAYKSLERRTARITTKLVCVADAMREQSLAAGIGRPEQYVTLHSGMEVGPFLNPPVGRGAVRSELGIGASDVVVGTVARLFHLKGHEDLLALAPELCARFANLRFLWVGDGILREQLEKRMESMGLRDRFVLTGLVKPERIGELVNAMDILVHPSRREGLARAIVQGQLARRPVVAYDVDGNREGFVAGESGYLVPAFDVRELGEKVAVLVEDGELRRHMGEAGRKFALARFDTKVMVEALERVYESAVFAPRVSPSSRLREEGGR